MEREKVPAERRGCVERRFPRRGGAVRLDACVPPRGAGGRVSGCRPVLPSPLPNNPTPGAPGGGPRPVGRWGRLIWDVTG